ncbi:MAG: hypothetical protein J7502_05520 [Flavisolibacter sp.]|nr:hypothetical protein [Flavisolibacter sp.]
MATSNPTKPPQELYSLWNASIGVDPLKVRCINGQAWPPEEKLLLPG